eukprot:6211849-Pleurochrysis_carterae.AAC.1
MMRTTFVLAILLVSALGMQQRKSSTYRMAGQSLESPQTAPYQRQRLMKSSLLRACRLRGGNAQQAMAVLCSCTVKALLSVVLRSL